MLQTTSDEYSTMDEDELVLFDHDTYHTKKLKHKCQRLVSKCNSYGGCAVPVLVLHGFLCVGCASNGKHAGCRWTETRSR